MVKLNRNVKLFYANMHINDWGSEQNLASQKDHEHERESRVGSVSSH